MVKVHVGRLVAVEGEAVRIISDAVAVAVKPICRIGRKDVADIACAVSVRVALSGI